MLINVELQIDNSPGRGCWVLIKHSGKPMMRFHCWPSRMPSRKDMEQDEDYAWRIIAESELLRFDTNGKSLTVRQF